MNESTVVKSPKYILIMSLVIINMSGMPVTSAAVNPIVTAIAPKSCFPQPLITPHPTAWELKKGHTMY